MLFEGRLPGHDWHILDHMMAEWQVQYCCIDFQPETNKASEFARRFPRHAGLVRYREGTTGTEIKETTDDQRVPFLTIDRTVFFDLALGRFHKGRIELPADVSGSFKEHVMAPCRTYQLDTMGNPQAKYVSRDKPDHLANSLVYAEIAHLKAYYRSTGRTMKVGESYSICKEGTMESNLEFKADGEAAIEAVVEGKLQEEVGLKITAVGVTPPVKKAKKRDTIKVEEAKPPFELPEAKIVIEEPKNVEVVEQQVEAVVSEAEAVEAESTPAPKAESKVTPAMLRELRANDPVTKRTCASCGRRVPIAKIGVKGQVCDDCK